MADEIAVRINLSGILDEFSESISENCTDNMYLIGYSADIHYVSEAEETLDFADVVTPGWCVMKNLDLVHSVDVGPDSSGIQRFIRVGPGRSQAFFFYPGTTVKAKATGPNVKLWARVFEGSTGT